MLLEPSSSTLGYPGEITQPLDANHNNVCKFANREDPNYQSVSSVLMELVKQYKDSGNGELSQSWCGSIVIENSQAPKRQELSPYRTSRRLRIF